MYNTQHKTYICFSLLIDINLYSKQTVWLRVDNDNDITKLGLESGPTIVPPMFTPHNMDKIVTKVTHLYAKECNINSQKFV